MLKPKKYIGGNCHQKEKVLPLIEMEVTEPPTEQKRQEGMQLPLMSTLVRSCLKEGLLNT